MTNISIQARNKMKQTSRIHIPTKFTINTIIIVFEIRTFRLLSLLRYTSAYFQTLFYSSKFIHHAYLVYVIFFTIHSFCTRRLFYAHFGLR